MSKAILISIRPEYVVNILNGNKTLELRKSVPKDFNGWVYIYVTKGKPYIRKLGENYFTECSVADVNKLNGKNVARFWFDEYIAYKYYEGDNSYFAKRPQDFCYTADEVIKRLCLSRDEFKTYGKGKDLYAWHIKKLEIFDEPLSLSDFYGQLRYPDGEIITPNICKYSTLDYDNDYQNCLDTFRLKKAPQSWQFVWVKEK